MPADFSQYVDLRIFDKTPGELYSESVEMARLTLPEFNLRVGTVEDAMFQAISYIAWQIVTGLNRLPDSLMSGILSMMGVTQRPAIPAEMTIEITADSYEGASIPSGTLFGYSYVFEDETIEYVFQTVESLDIPADESYSPGDPYPSGTVLCEAFLPGVIPVISEGESLTILSPSTEILSVSAGSYFQNGFNEENSAEFLSRAVSYLSSLSSTLAKSTQVDAFIANNYVGSVGRVKTYDLTNGDPDVGNRDTEKTYSITTKSRTGGVATLTTSEAHQILVGDFVVVNGIAAAGSPSNAFDGEVEVTAITSNTFSYLNTGGNVSSTSDAGTVTRGKEVVGHIATYVYGLGGFVGTEQKEIIKLAVAEAAIGGLTVNVENMEILPLSIAGSVVLDAAYDREPLEQIVENTIVEYLSPAGFPTYESTVRRNFIIGLISQIPGVKYVESLTVSGTTADGWLTQIGSDLEPAHKGWAPSLDPTDITLTYVSV